MMIKDILDHEVIIQKHSNEQKLFPHHIIEALDQRDRLQYPVLNGKQITDLVKKKVDVSSTITAERIAEMRKAGQIEFSELGYNQFVYWLPDERFIKQYPFLKKVKHDFYNILPLLNFILLLLILTTT